MENNKFLKKLLKVAAVALVFGLVAGGAFSAVVYFTGTLNNSKSTKVVVSSSDSKIDSTQTTTSSSVSDVSDIVDNAMPAIVAVTNTSTVSYRSFWGNVDSQESQSAGSGIIFAQDDDVIYIATNNHLVSDASNITITFCDEKTAEAQVVGTASSSDLAVLSVDMSDLNKDTISSIKTATIGDSSDLKVGQSAIVIGNSLGYGQTVTTGIISALDREISISDNSGNVVTNNLIQTDAAVNPGNSGGALLNLNGQVIGMVSAKYSDTSVEGVGYAIPITEASKIIESIITGDDSSDSSKSSNSQGYLGIAGMDIDRVTALGYGMPTGVYVSKVYSGSGADKAGVKKGDVITAVDGKTIISMDEIKEYLESYSKGDKVSVIIAQKSNDYQEKDITIKLGEK